MIKQDNKAKIDRLVIFLLNHCKIVLYKFSNEDVYFFLFIYSNRFIN